MKNTIATRLNRDDYNRLVKYCISNNIDKAEFVRMAILTNLNAVIPKIDDENSPCDYSHQLSNEDIKSIIAELVDQKVNKAIEDMADQDFQLKDRIFELEVNQHDLQNSFNFKLETIELKHNRFKEDFIKQSFLKINQELDKQDARIDQMYSYINSFFLALNDNFNVLGNYIDIVRAIIEKIIRVGDIPIDIKDKTCFPKFNKPLNLTFLDPEKH